MKTLIFAFLLVNAILCITTDSSYIQAGAVTNAHNRCYNYLAKYRADATMTFSIAYYNFVPRTTRSTSTSCYYAFAQNYDMYFNNGAFSSAKIGSNTPSQRVTISKVNAIAGSGYRIPSAMPSDTIGFAKNSIEENIIIDSIGNRVNINDITGFLSVPFGTHYSSTLLYVIWTPTADEDSIINSSEVISMGKITFGNGSSVPISSGFLQESDFYFTMEMDTTLFIPEAKINTIPGLSKSIFLGSGVDMNSITVSAFSEGGYGNFIESDIINPFMNADIKFAIEGLYDNSSDMLKRKDSVSIYLRKATSPYQIIDSAFGAVDSVSMSANVNFINAATGRYYLVVNNRNTLETWSRSGGDSLRTGYTGFYDFSSAQNNSFGGNSKQVNNFPSRFAIFSGDVNKDGTIDLTDIIAIYNDANNFVSGYNVTDLTGDDFVDLSDLTIAFNNSINFVSVIRP